MTPEEAYQRATAVFVGKVLTVSTRYTPRSKGSGPFAYHEVKLAVEKSWKLIDRQEITIVTQNTLQNTCGSFTEGESYLIYADVLNDIFFVSADSRTNRLAHADEDLRVLGEARLPTRSGEFRTYKVIVYGAVVCLALAFLIGLYLYRLNKKPFWPA